MTIALLVPVFNAENYIHAFVENLKQLPGTFDEILFYNDGSVDKSASILQSLGYPVIESKENSGPGYARNRLAEAATTDYIHFHDIDDEICVNFLPLMREKLSTSHADVIMGFADWVDADSRDLQIAWRYSESDIQEDPLTYFIRNPLGIISTAYRRAKFLSVNGFDENIKCWEDSDLHVRLAADRANFVVIKETIAISLRHENGISKNQNWCWLCRVKFLDRYIGTYRKINRSVFESELRKAAIAFVKMGAFRNLHTILDVNRKYNLRVPFRRFRLLHVFSLIVPPALLAKMLNLQRRLKL